MKIKKHWIFFIILLACIGLDFIFGWSKVLLDNGGLAYLRSVVEHNYLLAAVMYIILTAIACTILALPGVMFAIVAGVMFGPWLGSLLCLIGTTLGAVLSFVAGRYFLQDFVRPLIIKNKYLQNILFLEKPDNEIVVLMVTRLLPIFPFNLQNFAYGISSIGIIKYTVATFIFMTPGVVLFTLVTAGVIDDAVRNIAFIIAAIIIALIVGLTFYAKKVYYRMTTTGDAV